MATKLLWLGMDITDVQRFLGHENITTTRQYAETTAATLQRKFDQVTAPAARSLLSGIQHNHGDDAALLAAGLLARDSDLANQITSADA
ncbi:integrase family protein [Roseibium sp. TrichSKD4]|nr:integrase family protein [Roseibium sp. TrichSKD4]